MQSLTDGMRQRKNVVKAFKELDAFPKVPESYQETSTSGGTVSILTFLFIGVLVVSEFMYYTSKITNYTYMVDKDADHKIRINIDMTIAMECDDIGADVLDVSGTSIDIESHIRMEPSYFRMSKNQKRWWNAFRMIRQSEEGYRSINDVTSMHQVFGRAFATAMPMKEIKEFEGQDFDACHIYGNVEVNKVSGNFHITAGKSIPHPRGHAHLSSLVSELNYNFSHRIDLLSFGDPHPGIINPLDGELEIAEDAYHMFQYYIKIVPTNIKALRRDMKANQYSVTYRSRPISHSGGSHGVPGIFFKYDFHPICVNVIESYRDFSQFLIRLCGIIGGVFATSGMLHSFIGSLTEFIMENMRKRHKSGYHTGQNNTLNAPTTNTNAALSSSSTPQPLPTPSVSLIPPQQISNSSGT